MINHSLNDTAVKTNYLSSASIAELTQVCQDQMPHPRASFTHGLREIVYIAWIASEQSQYRHTECRQFYLDLAATDFHISPNALRPFLARFITCLDSLIENIRILNHRTLMSPYYHDSIIKVMRTLLDQVDSDVIDDLSHEFFELPPLGLPLLPQPLADTPTQQLADQWADVYKKDLLSSEADRRRFIAQLTQLVKKGRPLCAKESDYAIHQQQFNYYGTLSYFDRLDALAELTYGLARIVELVADTQDTPKRRDFFAHLEAILGKPANPTYPASRVAPAKKGKGKLPFPASYPV